MAETRVYLVIDAAASRTTQQWNLLKSGLKAKPVSASIIAAARGHAHNMVEINRLSVDKRYILGDFEIRHADRGTLLAILNEQATVHGISGQSTRETFRRVLLEEIKEVATEAGYPALAPLLDISIIGFGSRLTSTAAAHSWIADRRATWEPPKEE
jgi:hypothetical protein